MTLILDHIADGLLSGIFELNTLHYLLTQYALEGDWLLLGDIMRERKEELDQDHNHLSLLGSENIPLLYVRGKSKINQSRHELVSIVLIVLIRSTSLTHVGKELLHPNSYEWCYGITNEKRILKFRVKILNSLSLHGMLDFVTYFIKPE